MSGRRRKGFVPAWSPLARALLEEELRDELVLTHESTVIPGERHLGARDDCRTCRRQRGKG